MLAQQSAWADLGHLFLLWEFVTSLKQEGEGTSARAVPTEITYQSFPDKKLTPSSSDMTQALTHIERSF